MLITYIFFWFKLLLEESSSIFTLHVNTKSLPIYRKNDRKVLLITVRSTTLDAFYWDSLYVVWGVTKFLFL